MMTPVYATVSMDGWMGVKRPHRPVMAISMSFTAEGECVDAEDSPVLFIERDSPYDDTYVCYRRGDANHVEEGREIK